LHSLRLNMQENQHSGQSCTASRSCTVVAKPREIPIAAPWNSGFTGFYREMIFHWVIFHPVIHGVFLAVVNCLNFTPTSSEDN
jgi:hypothetical protein